MAATTETRKYSLSSLYLIVISHFDRWPSVCIMSHISQNTTEKKELFRLDHVHVHSCCPRYVCLIQFQPTSQPLVLRVSAVAEAARICIRDILILNLQQ